MRKHGFPRSPKLTGEIWEVYPPPRSLPKFCASLVARGLRLSYEKTRDAADARLAEIMQEAEQLGRAPRQAGADPDAPEVSGPSREVEGRFPLQAQHSPRSMRKPTKSARLG